MDALADAAASARHHAANWMSGSGIVDVVDFATFK
jgi:hypothetical protein